MSVPARPPYVMVNDQGTQNVRPPPYGANFSRYQSHYYQHKRSRGGNCCLWCCCCTCCCIFLPIFVIAVCAVYFYAIYKPELPRYEVGGISIKAFDIQPDFVQTDIDVVVEAENPNRNIKLRYGRDSKAVVIYSDSVLGSGKLPEFVQGYENTTMMSINLNGKNEFGSGLQQALAENIQKGKVPLLVKVKAPISIVFWDLSLRQFLVYVNCSFVVDNLAPNKKIQILSSNYSFGFAL